MIRNKPAFYRVEYYRGRLAFVTNHPRTDNPHESDRKTPRGKLKWTAWARGWVDACYARHIVELRQWRITS